MQPTAKQPEVQRYTPVLSTMRGELEEARRLLAVAGFERLEIDLLVPMAPLFDIECALGAGDVAGAHGRLAELAELVPHVLTFARSARDVRRDLECLG
ncbi:hypothetical protein [Labilithrix luteola]|nr:hypothetical protein [Labilithrix luteola]